MRPPAASLVLPSRTCPCPGFVPPMSLLQLASLKSVLCLGAHCDDIEIGCGGLLLQIAAAAPDAKIHWVVFSGAAERQAEARQSAAEFLSPLQVEITCFDFPDARFPAVWESVKNRFHAECPSGPFDLVLSHRIDDAHQDHRVVSELTRQRFREHDVVEYEIPKFDADLGRPSLYVPLSERIARQKAEAIVRLFPSQAAKPWFSAEVLLALARVRGVECRAEFAEAFYPWKLSLR